MCFPLVNTGGSGRQLPPQSPVWPFVSCQTWHFYTQFHVLDFLIFTPISHRHQPLYLINSRKVSVSIRHLFGSYFDLALEASLEQSGLEKEKMEHAGKAGIPMPRLSHRHALSLRGATKPRSVVPENIVRRAQDLILKIKRNPSPFLFTSLVPSGQRGLGAPWDSNTRSDPGGVRARKLSPNPGTDEQPAGWLRRQTDWSAEICSHTSCLWEHLFVRR